jgi:hypothetical protein
MERKWFVSKVKVKLIESIFNAWNNKEYLTGLLCDLTKAFNSVSYELLILKL